jgi:cephalosporin hydroxylase
MLDRAAAVLALTGRPVVSKGSNTSQRRPLDSGAQLVDEHFVARSLANHVNHASMRDTIELLHERPSLILETGSSAWGPDSSRLFDGYVACFGGEFATVDKRIAPLLRLRRDLGPRSRCVCDDSVRFLRAWAADNPGRKVDLVYLDSFDLDPVAPTAAAIHALMEFEAIRPALGAGSLLLVDDTPASVEFFPAPQRPMIRRFVERTGLVPGKGMLIDVYLRNDPTVLKIHHAYQVLYRFVSDQDSREPA